jgi:hypothetical protein
MAETPTVHGGRILEQMIAQLDGKARLDWRAAGLVCEIALQTSLG